MILYSSKTGFRFSQRSLDSLKDVHPILVSATSLGLFTYSEQDFLVLEGLRSKRRQEILVAQNRSQTMRSKHLRQPDGFAHAVDLVPVVDGNVPWKRIDLFEKVYSAMSQAFEMLGVSFEWGGNWESFKDYSHYQLKER